MFPRPKSLCCPNCGFSHAVHSCKLVQSSLRRADFFDVVRRKLSQMLTLATDTAAFMHHVLCVVFGRTQKQVGRIDASPIIAAMADAQPPWMAECKKPHFSMCAPRPTLYFAFSVAMLVQIAQPVPAFVFRTFIDFGPETGYALRSHGGNVTP